MKRSPALAPLSRDHQHGLAAGQRLVRATAQTAADARMGFLEFWQAECRRHFEVEEQVLLPVAAARLPPEHEAVVRVLVDHVEIRRRADDLRDDTAPPVESLHELGDLLRCHIRHEERVLFPLIEAALPRRELAALAVAVERAEGRR
jgi:hemerythrin-like domain-containing protein